VPENDLIREYPFCLHRCSGSQEVIIMRSPHYARTWIAIGTGAVVFSAAAASLTVFTAGWETTGSSMRLGALLWLGLLPLSTLALLAAAEPEAPAEGTEKDSTAMESDTDFDSAAALVRQTAGSAR
jgi:hypothetical protein